MAASRSRPAPHSSEASSSWESIWRIGWTIRQRTISRRRRTASSSATSSRSTLREFQVRLAEAVDEDAHEGLVEADLAGVGRGAQGFGLDLDDGDLLGRDDGGGAAARIPGEVQDLAEAAAGLDGVQR